MEDTPLSKRPWFYIAVWLAVLLVLYGWQIFRIGGVQASILYILIDLACIFPTVLVACIAFFAQFVLPVRTLSDRQKIFDRLITYLSGGHGPALFIENGVIKEHAGERLKQGPGVVWLDSASAAITRTSVKIKQTMGPGVYFLDRGEFIAATLDLHTQAQSIGPKESDHPFDDQSDDLDDSEYHQIQDRRKQVSAWTRDGIEVVPNISVSFRVDTGFPTEGQPGSRFGYRIGITKKDKQKEQQDKDAIQKALLGEGINPNMSSDSPRRRVAWNQLPASLAVDIWREYVAKFTLDELFKPTQLVPPPPPQIPEPLEEEIDPLTQRLEVNPNQSAIQRNTLSTLREINRLMDRTIKRLDKTAPVQPTKPTPGITPSTASPTKGEPQKRTALQVINEMIKARLTQAEVDVIDDHGTRLNGTALSPEFALLQRRGLKVLSVGVSNVRLNPAIEGAIINKWSGTWLSTAKEENKQIERKRNIIEAAGQEQAIRQYAEKLSIELLRKKPQGFQETLKTLIMRTRGIIIENENLRQNMGNEQTVLEEIIKWMEVNGS
ncbi:MAG: hypothetical protein ABI904_04605 [Chloroflexota bacterium]